MRKILLCLLVILSTIEINAQINSSKKQSHKGNAIGIGFMAGINHSTFTYSEYHLKSLPNNLLLRPNIGFFVNIPINKEISIAPSLSLYNKGTLTKYIYEQTYDVIYTAKSRYFSVRIPIYYYINKRLNSKYDVKPFYNAYNSVQPFIVIAPSYNYLLGGNINLSQPQLPIEDVSVNIGKANMNIHDICIFLGGGISLNKFSLHTKLEIGYNIGIINNFSDMEINETAQSYNINAYNINGKRFNHNIELNIYISLPIRTPDKECKECNKRYPKYSNSNKMNQYRKKNHKSIINFRD